MEEVTLDRLLTAKEERVARRDELRARRGLPVVSLTINMPGPRKDGPEARLLLQAGLAKVRERLGERGTMLVEERTYYLPTGPEALLAVRDEPLVLKRICVEIEESAVYGRLWDFDVIAADGSQLSRVQLGLPARQCLLCRDHPAACARRQAHQPAELMARIRELTAACRAERTRVWPRVAGAVGAIAVESMLMEAACTPAPGLVDRNNSGAHRDMDFFTFMKSSGALAETMLRCAVAGWEHDRQPPRELLPVLRAIGRDGESAMYAAIGGVNAQKGLIFILGILCAAASQVIRRTAAADPGQVLDAAAAICEGITGQDLEPLLAGRPDRRLTAGEELFLRYGVRGVRGEVEDGLLSIKAVGLPGFRQGLSAGLDLNDSLVHALLALMTVVEDTTVLHRHDMLVLRSIQAEAARIMADGGMTTAEGRIAVSRLDESFTKRNISPGGSADLLAATYFVHVLGTKDFGGGRHDAGETAMSAIWMAAAGGQAISGSETGRG